MSHIIEFERIFFFFEPLSLHFDFHKFENQMELEITGLLQKTDLFYTKRKERHTFVLRKREKNILLLGRTTQNKVIGKMKQTESTVNF